ncbi:S8 family peptidase [Geomonas nitrogeniifigens]|uniref:S8 family peptidase n=1 Tax=Geomonas diazotrophica TaxID=2843197 RepID=A0ABX8JKM6_9BACT|nr:S8 family peptidase [Geomonas nitrogeniifigens]QWV97179.1 S8 family peptidase [Geomonas nitrogeniifigens]
MTRIPFGIALLGILSLVQVAAAAPDDPAPIYGVGAERAIPGRYIVVFRPGSPGQQVSAAVQAAGRLGGKVHYLYTDALQGFAATLPDQALQGVRHNPNVEYIEQDQAVSIGIEVSQAVSTWNLDRIDQRALPLDGYFNYLNSGVGVTAYVIDTGIRTSHTEFGGRASIGYDALGGNGQDCNGHGTHVSGTIGGSHYGVAKDVALVGVRVLDCSGSGAISGVVSGVDWVTKYKKLPAVANMSLGGGASTALDSAVSNSINGGVTYAIAAGNSKQDACRYSPARVPAALTVGATTSSDARASYSNYGACLDLFAPGSNVTSSWYSSDTATATLSGTSMATPNVTGVAAQYLQTNPTATPAGVAAALTGNATPGVVGNPGKKSPNLLLFTDY